MDTRATRLAEVLLHHSLRVQPGDKLIIAASDFTAGDLIRECYRLATKAGVRAEVDIAGIQLHRGRSDAVGLLQAYFEGASQEHAGQSSELTELKLDWGNKFMFITSVHDDLFLGGVDPAKLDAWRAARFPLFHKIMPKAWVLTYYPTKAMAQGAEMSLEHCIDFYYNACLIDYAEEAKRLQALQDILDAGSVVHIVAPGTDLRIGIEGRLAAGTNLGRRNVPDGECFIGPEETVTEGIITFELPQVRDGKQVEGIHLQFKEGQIVSASAEKQNDFLQRVLDSHPGNRRLGELGIGMNRHITKYMKSTLFDEKIAGTIHMAIGQSYKEERGGGKNDGNIHWDLVKDLRSLGTLVTVDGRAIIRDGEVLV